MPSKGSTNWERGSQGSPQKKSSEWCSKYCIKAFFVVVIHCFNYIKGNLVQSGFLPPYQALGVVQALPIIFSFTVAFCELQFSNKVYLRGVPES